ncbi:MAG: DUF5329 family protein [Planctomycetota bacterium]
MTIYQRASKRLPGVNGFLRVGFSDITAGQVLVTVYGPSGEALSDATTMREGDILALPLAEQDYVLRLERLVNVLVGHDFGVLSLMPSQVWQAKTRIPSRLDFPWEEARMTIGQRASRDLPGVDGFLRVQLGDITAGQVPVTLYGPKRELAVDTTLLRKGDVLSLSLAERDYVLRLVGLVNLVVGDDYAVFSLMLPHVWEAEKINSLLDDIIAASDAIFLRNEEELSGPAFAGHLRRKHQHYGPMDASVDEFIEKVASQSAPSGKPYHARLPGGEIVDVGVWLREHAARMTSDRSVDPLAASRDADATGGANR